MKRQYLIFFAILTVFVLTINDVSAFAPETFVEGINENPSVTHMLFPPPPPKEHFIYTEDDLKAMDWWSNSSNAFYLMNDIEIADTVWIPIGSAAKPFSGSFYGCNHTIVFKNDVALRSPANQEGDGYGFFGNIEQAKICDLNLIFQKNLTSEYNNTGSLAGKADSGSSVFLITNCTVQNNKHTISGEKNVVGSVRNIINYVVQSIKHVISGEKNVGGVIGDIANCTSQSTEHTISGKNNVGGLIGNFTNGNIFNCSSDFSVIANGDNAGGLVGYSYSGMIENSSALGSVEAKGKNAGGVVGYIQLGDVGTHFDEQFEIFLPNVTISNSSAGNSVKSEEYAGGLVGYIFNSIIIENSSASGPVDPSGKFGGFIGGWDEEHKPEIINCFYQDKEVDLTNQSA